MSNSQIRIMLARKEAKKFKTSRASPENPSSSWEDVFKALDGVDGSGLPVNADSALKYSPVWAAVNRISGDISKVPLIVYKRTGEGKDKAPKHPAYRLLKYDPNPYMTAKPFWQSRFANALLKGNSYSWIERDATGKPIALYPLDADSTHALKITMGGSVPELWYVTMIGGQQVKINSDEIIHLRGLGDNGIDGLSVVKYAKWSIGMGKKAQRYSVKFYENNARPSMILEHPATLSEEAAKKLVGDWNRLHSGVDNSNKTALLEEGMKAHEISINARDAQMIETLNFSIRDVSNWFSIPPHKLGDTSRTAYNSLEQENISYLVDALDPWMVTCEQECRKKLLTEREKENDSHIIEYKRQALIQADIKSRYEAYKIATGGRPFMTPDEVRSAENMNILGGDAAELKDPTNNFEPQEPTPEPENEPESNSKAIKASEKAVADAQKRMLKRMAIHYKKAKTPEARREFWATHEEKHGEVVRSALIPAVECYCALTGGETENKINEILTEIINEVKAL